MNNYNVTLQKTLLNGLKLALPQMSKQPHYRQKTYSHAECERTKVALAKLNSPKNKEQQYLMAAQLFKATFMDSDANTLRLKLMQDQALLMRGQQFG